MDAVLGDRPNQLERLLLYGLPGARYGIVTGTNVAEPTLWSLVPEVEVIGPADQVEQIKAAGKGQNSR